MQRCHFLNINMTSSLLLLVINILLLSLANFVQVRQFIQQDVVQWAKKNPSTVVYLKPRRHRWKCPLPKSKKGKKNLPSKANFGQAFKKSRGAFFGLLWQPQSGPYLPWQQPAHAIDHTFSFNMVFSGPQCWWLSSLMVRGIGRVCTTTHVMRWAHNVMSS